MTPETETPRSLAVNAGSESSTHWLLEGQRRQGSLRWDAIGNIAETEAEAREEERSYREYMADSKTGWFDFRVVRVTTTREILPNDKAQPRSGEKPGAPSGEPI